MSSEKNTISIVVPCHIQHLRHIDNIISGAISKQTLKPDEVVFVINPVFNPHQEHEINHIFDSIKKDYEFVKYVNVEYSCTPGKARNIGFSHSNGEIIVFTDADDLYHPMRNEIISRVFEDHDCDIVLHDYLFREQFTGEKIDYESIVVDRCIPNPNDKTNNQPENNDFNIAQGHASFKRDILEKIKYDEVLIPSEDGEILRRTHKENKKLVCIDAKLSSWFPSGSWQ